MRELFPFLSIFVAIFATVKLCINPVLHLELLECVKVLNRLSLFLLVSLTSLADATNKVKAMVCVSCSALSDSLRPHGLYPTRLLCSWNPPGKNIGVGCHSLLQGIFWPRSYALRADSLPSEPPLLLFSCQVMSDSLRPHELQHSRLPFFTIWVGSNSCPLSQCCHSPILASVTPFTSCPQTFPASGSLPMDWLFTSGGQSIGASASVLLIFRVDIL